MFQIESCARWLRRLAGAAIWTTELPANAVAMNTKIKNSCGYIQWFFRRHVGSPDMNEWSRTGGMEFAPHPG